MAPTWHFRTMHRGEVNVDPIQSEFFNTEALGSIAAALVREFIQNSLDARIPNVKTRVRIWTPDNRFSLSPEVARPYLENLWPHLKSPANGLSDIPAQNAPLTFLVMEDFGTRGLRGDPRQHDDTPGGDNDFYYFWRNVGRSGKGNTDRGRWGLGKNVFSASSRINTFFALTVRDNDNRRMLMGQSVLKIHHLGSDRYDPYGYYAETESDGFAVPIDNPQLANQFCKDFRLVRESNAGLSVVIPYPDEEITSELLVKSVISQYFFAILSDALIVTLVTARGEVVIDSETIIPLVERIGDCFKKEMSKVLELAKWAWEMAGNPLPEVQSQPRAAIPRWEVDLVPGELQKDIQDRFDRGCRIAIRVPIWIRRKDQEAKLSHFDVFLERDTEIQSARPVFMREGVIISEVGAARQHGVRAMVIVEDGPLAAFLGDAENPAHTEWQERSTKVKSCYDHGPSCLRFVKNAVGELVRLIANANHGLDEKTLKDIFSLPISAPDQEEKKKEKERGKEPEKVVVPAIVQRIRIDRVERGFCVRAGDENATLPEAISVHVAYEVRRGNPFKKYKTADFELDRAPISVVRDSASLLACEGNRMTVGVLDRKFHVTVTGFDPLRDLKVKVVKVDVFRAEATQ